ncbi:MAG: sulfotransferase, partial [Nodosilinea sp.]
MGNIYWLASYPKSGNTWMRILLTNYLRNADSPAAINSLDGGPIAS